MSGAKDKPTGKLKYVDPAEFTPHFAWKSSASAAAGDEVFCEDIPLSAVAEKFGTPTYLYSHAAIAGAFREFGQGLKGLEHILCFAMKSNGNLSILKALAKLGSGFDIVSGGELRLLRRIGVSGDRIVFSGVGKSREEIREALNYQVEGESGCSGILLFIWYTAIQNGFGGKVSVRTLVRRSLRWNHFGERCAGWLDL